MHKRIYAQITVFFRLFSGSFSFFYFENASQNSTKNENKNLKQKRGAVVRENLVPVLTLRVGLSFKLFKNDEIRVPVRQLTKPFAVNAKRILAAKTTICPFWLPILAAKTVKNLGFSKVCLNVRIYARQSEGRGKI